MYRMRTIKRSMIKSGMQKIRSGLAGTVGTYGMGLYGEAHQVYIDYRAVPKDRIEISPRIWK